ncbi:hypothetical protein FF38_06740 [Lucilia cuprina]|uniref:Uncharacterized protein n=1 Tax=Lucilia cuprina TaxID=7375 RepID=A0A0L0CRB2_LUCCU|nr:hypothetical protein FF38_06740 [Lucilia cuprina]
MYVHKHADEMTTVQATTAPRGTVVQNKFPSNQRGLILNPLQRGVRSDYPTTFILVPQSLGGVSVAWDTVPNLYRIKNCEFVYQPQLPHECQRGLSNNRDKSKSVTLPCDLPVPTVAVYVAPWFDLMSNQERQRIHFIITILHSDKLETYDGKLRPLRPFRMSL